MSDRKSPRRKGAKRSGPSPQRLAAFIVFVGVVGALAFLFVRTDPVIVTATEQFADGRVDELIVEFPCGAAVVDLLVARPRDGADLGDDVKAQPTSTVALTSDPGECRDNALARLPLAAIGLCVAIAVALAVRRAYLWLAVSIVAVGVLWGYGRVGTYPLLLGAVVAAVLLGGLVWLMGG